MVKVMTRAMAQKRRMYMAVRVLDRGLFQPSLGRVARSTRCESMRTTTYATRTPALRKICAAIATREFVGLVAQTILSTQVQTRAIQSPNIAQDIRNLWPFRRLDWYMYMLPAAPTMYRRRKTEVTGISVPIVGRPPTPAT